MYFTSVPYGLETHIESHGSENMFRGESFGQPRTLVPGDVLANGHEIAEDWSEEGNGGVGLHFTDGTMRTVAARIPLLLANGEQGKFPIELGVGDILETGCVVLAEPSTIDTEDPWFQESRNEVQITLTGGYRGHKIGMPSDLVIALSHEQYPPSTETEFGVFVIENTLKMGASARKNLPDYGRLDGQSEYMRVSNIFDSVKILSEQARDQKGVYERSLALLKEQCRQLNGVELLITGRIAGRGGTKVFKNDPRSLVENLLVEVWSASVNTHEGHGDLVKQHQPFIEFHGRTVEDNEQISAWIGVGDYGVSVKLPETNNT